MLILRSCIYDKLEKTYYFCEFDIPLKNLINCFGLGFYFYKSFPRICFEFAIDASKFKKEYLTKIQKDPIGPKAPEQLDIKKVR